MGKEDRERWSHAKAIIVKIMNSAARK